MNHHIIPTRTRASFDGSTNRCRCKMRITQKNRCLYRSICFLALVAGAYIFKDPSIIEFGESTNSKDKQLHTVDHENHDQYTIRRMKEKSPQSLFSSKTNMIRFMENSTTFDQPNDGCPEIETQITNNNVSIIIYIIGVLYMFVTIAITCDECFVPALEVIASDKYMNLSMDVAGATLMAAGGSAPEFFTSLFGTFQETEVGFGTIVGSAVFNVCFVIGMCAIFSKELLTLTWWPLFRDCVWYTISLLTLALFCGYSSPGEITLVEAIIQFTLYICYVIIMKYNERLWGMIERRNSSNKVSDRESVSNLNAQKNGMSHGKASTFRAGLLALFMGKGSLLERVGLALVTRIEGDASTVFESLDENKDGFLDRAEFLKIIDLFDSNVSVDEIDNAINELDDDHNGKIDIKEFTSWYIKSEKRLMMELRKTFHKYDVDKSGTIDATELKLLMRELGSDYEEEDVYATLEEAHTTGPSNQITFDEFCTWYTHSKYWDTMKSNVDNSTGDDQEESMVSHLKPPSDCSVLGYLRWALLFPIVGVLCLTIVDVRKPGREKWCFVSFIGSIVWIGISTYFMVSWAAVIGDALGIPIVLMGLTILAAGTSVPDLITSVIVARMGEGDMAVSSSIGSNIFDITVGLPVPWLLYSIVNYGNKTVQIGTSGMTRSIIILLIMVVCIVFMIHISGWNMTKTLGAGMFVLYFAYLAQAIWTEMSTGLLSC